MNESVLNMSTDANRTGDSLTDSFTLRRRVIAEMTFLVGLRAGLCYEFAGLGLRSRERDQFLQGLTAALRTGRNAGLVDKQLKLIVTLLTLIIVDRHRSVIQQNQIEPCKFRRSGAALNQPSEFSLPKTLLDGSFSISCSHSDGV